ncbi:MAG: DNA mismatch repair protein MutS [Chloroflexi bacterium]|nr:DNA mismatch repair protein MutS [Chloroflexota bacterium]
MSTPVRRQYLQIKQQYPDAILFFRLGDFYETFDEDAKIVAQVCDIALTSRPVGKGVRVPLAGVPYHSADTYIAKLLKAGYKVAICEQEGNTPVKGLVPRRVVRVVTPGTLIEPHLLPEKANNYLVALAWDERGAGLAYVDISTGEFAVTEIRGEEWERQTREELARLHPAEVIYPGGDVFGEEVPPPPFLSGLETTISPYTAWRFDEETARERLRQHFHVQSLAGFGIEGKPLAIRAAGALLAYLEDTQPAALKHLDTLHTYTLDQFMTLDEATRRALELVTTMRDGSTRGSLLWVLDHTLTPMGGRLLRRWVLQPLLDVDALNARLDMVQAWVDQTLPRMALQDALRGMGDLERWTNRVLQGVANPRDLVGLREALARVESLHGPLSEVLSLLPEDHPLHALARRVDPCEDVADLLRRALAEEPPATTGHPGLIAAGYSEELDAIKRAATEAKTWIANLERRERERTGIKNLKVGYNKVFGYYIEVTKANTHLVPEDYVRKQTLVNAERYITPELKEYESLVLNAQERIIELETRLFRELVEQVAREGHRLLNTARAVAELDVLLSLAQVAVTRGYTRPQLAEDGVLTIREGRHPVVEVTLDKPFVPNDTHMTPDAPIHIITGPNMAGKSTYLRQVALITLMAQIGSFVPAAEAHIGLVDRIFTRIGAGDEIHRGQSTFMVEMLETAHILHHATSRSLVVLDEVGRGTSTYDGMAIAWALVEYIHNHPRLRCKTLFATHYHELTRLAERLPGVRNFRVDVAEEGGRVIFLHKIVPGGADKSYGVHVAELAGMPRQVVQRARELMAEMEANGAAPLAPSRSTPQPQVVQLPLFAEEHPVVSRLRELDINQMTPLEALNTLYELQKEVMSND